MGWTPLASSWAKYYRAGTHLNALDAELGVHGRDTEAIGVEIQSNSGEAFIRLTRLPDFRDAGLILGDAVNNYRAALDHLAWDLVKLGTNPSPKRPQDVQYPLAQSWANLSARRESLLPGVDDTAFGLIREHQPYRRDNRGFLLRTLRGISDVDKHRNFIPPTHAMSGFVGRTTLVRCTLAREWRCTPRSTLRVGMKLYRVWYVPAGPNPQVQIESEMAMQPCLTRGVPLMATIFALRDEVLSILSAFEDRIA